jgi:hypothetical protein
VKGENPANHILINSSSERQVDLISNLGASPSRIALFHLDDRANQLGRWTFGTWFCSLLWRKQPSILSLNKSAMKAQQRGWFEEKGYALEAGWLSPQRTESGDKTIPDAEIGRPLT